MLQGISDETLDTLAYEAECELARQNYRDYVEFVHHGHYMHFAHTELVCSVLQRIADGEHLSVLIEMPPRHGKSMTVTESFPSYYLGRNPNKRIITAAYSDGLAKKFGRLNRNKFNEFAYELFGEQLSVSNAAVKDWGVEGKAGGMIATGIGGSITGHGADLMIIDDPIKNMKEAMSQTIRDAVWDEWEATLSTRLQGDACSLIVIMTRWHEDDLIGRLLVRSPRKWIRLRLPAIAEDEDDLLNRALGEPLCRELGYDEKWATNKKAEVGSRTWASLYQQRPAPAGGNIFKREWIRYYVRTEEQKRQWGLSDDVIVLPTHFDKVAQSWDCTFKDTSTSDFVAGGVWSRKGAHYFLLDVEHRRMGFADTMKAIRAMADKWPQARSKYIEDKANGSAVIEMLKDEISGIIAVNPDGGKEARAHAVSPLFEAGNVYLPHPNICSWVENVIEELVSFPNAAHDDFVDMTTQALNQLYTNNTNLLDRFKQQAGY
ncbi:phage terminase large subunit [Lysinibacillus piscis]|uniref:Terminase large subunit gp17-like C-terminal domain-containing protein n=1 Tax=Lysinibacillus piscis TaxID=2518931 RepID=A0ABQ5NIX2_9BACI|nr:phage terminase large subunit [Lysinibacillus sp. KH24]GLC88244.1 hypothetical protein LYSBPC_13710 [Lysinibacillus sp. KH24]